MRGRKACFLKVCRCKIPSGCILCCDCFDGCFRVNVRVDVADDYGDLVFRGREVRIVDRESADTVQLQVLCGSGAFQTAIKRFLEFLEKFCPDLYVESAAMVRSDVFDIFLQVRDFQRSFQTNVKLAE